VLEALGIDHQVETVYLALLRQPAADAGEIAVATGLSADMVHQALDELARLALVRPSWENPGTIRPVRPDIGLEYLLVREQNELLERQNQIESSRAAITALIADLSNESVPSPAELTVTKVIGLDAIRAKLEQLAYSTLRQVLSLAPDGPQTPDNMEASRPLDEMLLRRGVQMRTVYLESVRNDPLSKQYAKWLLEQGGEVRLTAVLPLRMLILDRQTVVVPLNPQHSEVGVAVVTGSGLALAMCALFDGIWESATPYGDVQAARHGEQLAGDQLTQQQLAVIRLLADGDTDTAISRKLGISLRTAGRLVSEIMTALNVRSRFQAGVRTGELGWHHSSPGQRGLCRRPHRVQPSASATFLANADFRTGTSTLGSGELEAELASAPPGDGGVVREAGVAEDE
jgi:sugar-specific transcriptional regulator TrmB/DNA-binding CsgD family transcriptional regulator